MSVKSSSTQVTTESAPAVQPPVQQLQAAEDSARGIEHPITHLATSYEMPVKRDFIKEIVARFAKDERICDSRWIGEITYELQAQRSVDALALMVREQRKALDELQAVIAKLKEEAAATTVGIVEMHKMYGDQIAKLRAEK